MSDMNASIVSTIDTIFQAVEKQFGVKLDVRIKREETHLVIMFNDADSIYFTDKQFARVQECIARCFYVLGFTHAFGDFGDSSFKWFRWLHETALAICPGINFAIGETELQQTVQRAIAEYIALLRRDLTATYDRLNAEIAEREERRNEIVAMLAKL